MFAVLIKKNINFTQNVTAWSGVLHHGTLFKEITKETPKSSMVWRGLRHPDSLNSPQYRPMLTDFL